MKKKCLILLVLLLTVSCSGFKKDYKIVDASSKKRPAWVQKEKYSAPKKDEYKYFVSRGENANERLCEKTAVARATSVVASEIATEINDAYNQSIKNNNNISVSEITSEDLKQTINMYMAGIENEEKYWEKRKYSVELGADKDRTSYVCYALIKMNKKTYNSALNASIDKMMDNLKKTENREKINQLSQEIKDNLLNN